MPTKRTDKETCRLALALSAAALALAAEAKLKTSWDVGDYVQDGLIAHYDGIRNMGADLPHSSTATTWSNLVANTSGTGLFKKMKGISDGDTPDHGAWTDKGYRFKGYSYFQTENTLELGANFTVQILGDFDMADYADGVHLFHKFWASADGGTSISLGLDRAYDTTSSKLGNLLYFYADKYKGDGSRPQFTWSGKYATAAFDDKYAYLTETPYYNTKDWGFRREITQLVPVPPLVFAWGGKYASNNSPQYCSKGEFYAWRAYSRRLTDAELLWNRLIDDMRYRGSTAAPTNAVIAADEMGRCGAEPPGAYAVDGTHTFSASTATAGCAVYKAVGYELETWDPAAGAWGEAECHDGSAVTVKCDPSAPPVRIKWRWEFASGLERFDAKHYVQDGLVAHYDGIRNSGMDAPHDNGASFWIDLAPESGRRAKLIVMKGISGDDVPAPGAWTDNGFEFKGYSYFETLDNTLELGSNFTVQVVTEMELSDFADGVHKYHNVWGSSETSCGMFLDRSYAGGISTSNLIFKVDKYNANGGTGNRPAIGGWDGLYATFAFNDEFTHAYATEFPYWWKTSKWGRQREHVLLKGLPPFRYVWGGKHAGNDSPENCGKGKFYAWRAYSRMLTDDELAWNRDVDEVRFHGKLPVSISNAVVVATAQNGFSAAEEGAYLLTGSHEFTAERRQIGGTTYAPVHSVETWDAKAGTWAGSVKTRSGSCILHQADGIAPRRIVWSWRKEGFSVILR